MKTSALTGILIGTIIVAGGGGFWGGMIYQKGQAPSLPNFAALGNRPGSIGANGMPGAERRVGGGQGGEITAKASDHLTIKLTNGSTETVYYSTATKVFQDTAVTADTLAVGQTVQVTGTPNSDGSQTATALRLTTQ